MSRPAAAFTINMTISVKAETHVMILHMTRKFVTAMPTSVTHGQQKSYDNNITICTGNKVMSYDCSFLIEDLATEANQTDDYNAYDAETIYAM